MQTTQHVWTDATGWRPGLPVGLDAGQRLVLAFGSPELARRDCLFEDLRKAYPGSTLAGCSTAGEVEGVAVHDHSLVATVIRFARSTFEGVEVELAVGEDGAEAARRIAQALVRPGLRHVFALCDGLRVNGSAFAHALHASLPAGVSATGGLAADGERFVQTLVCFNGPGRPGRAVGIGLYGDALRLGFGSLGGWDSFGPTRTITRSCGNILHELDGEAALALYKSYLGEHSTELPRSALLFPLLLEDAAGGGLVRSVLGVDEAAGSLTFAGDVPQGARARLMKANFDRLVDGAVDSAQASALGMGGTRVELAILVSCVGRKLVLRQRVEEEIEAVRDVLPQAVLAGFYSYGELCPQRGATNCELHNQTMTITTLAEAHE
jgi:hypothetical protein